MVNLTGKTALVTGGASGIGLATVRKLSEQGAMVAVNYLPGDEAAASVVEGLRSEGLHLVHAPGDVSEYAAVKEMVEKACESLGGLDMLVNNAARGTVRPIPFEELDEMTEDVWQGILATNLMGPFSCARVAAPELKKRSGAIVNMASVAGLGVRGSSIAYAASKAALINLTTSLSRALSPDVRVNAVAPALVETPWISTWPEERKQRTKEQCLMGRIAQPSDVADVVMFLLTGTSYVNGQTIVVDGGRV
ncbi:SDR family NAD(P)-dependent oxidoreductase [Agrobacterium larrymoorei]|uniref:SDR family oxidoreductase n=1 Tax=Agrobacterium larrymoorei TaxID=160699 RepID=A0AAF0KGZ4_9HYPH|nr:SDR family oxidoreductase [Agrobacterium larrymoorei]WHA43887.1 SDR family oxidoreductase [Agrobacterium larrymoorei]